MKKLGLLLVSILIIGCSATLPAKPQWRQIEYHLIKGGIILDAANVAILLENLQKSQAYQEQLEKIITGEEN